MYIEPNTDIRILRNVPLDKTYEHTASFASATAQYNYFHSKEKYALAHYSYQRANRGYLRVGIRAENLYDCNYMMFRNTAFGNKWFYAFIDRVEYVNDVTAEIRFTIDVMQSWLFDFTLEECWVERQHTTSDLPGEHQQEENLDIGELVFERIGEVTFKPEDCAIIVASTMNVEGGVISSETASGDIYSGLYSGVKYKAIYTDPSSDPTMEQRAQQVNTYLKAITESNRSEGVVSVFMYPKRMMWVNSQGEVVPGGIRCQTNDFTLSASQEQSARTKLGTYTPRNKKLLGYPYNTLYVYTDEGASANYRFEKFNQNVTKFTYGGDISCAPSMILYPRNYKGIDQNFNERISLNQFPQCAYVIDAYRAWVASRGGHFLSGASELAGVVGGAMSTAAAVLNTADQTMRLADAPSVGQAASTIGANAAVWNGLANVSASIGAARARRSQPPQSHGQSSSYPMFTMGAHGFHFYQAHIMPEYAAILDNFFDRFGYKINRLQVPRYNVRTYYTYVKTRGCNIRGGLPQDDIEAICRIFDNGVTFWNGGDHIGDYGYAISHGNVPLSE